MGVSQSYDLLFSQKTATYVEEMVRCRSKTDRKIVEVVKKWSGGGLFLMSISDRVHQLSTLGGVSMTSCLFITTELSPFDGPMRCGAAPWLSAVAAQLTAYTIYIIQSNQPTCILFPCPMGVYTVIMQVKLGRERRCVRRFEAVRIGRRI